jgi:peptidyl-prolyl cis-trans isomerase SurA
MWNGCTKTLLLALLLPVFALAQPDAPRPAGQLIDGMIGVVGQEMLMHSDLIQRLEQARQAGEPVDNSARCGMLEDMLYEKLLLEQARLDSVFVDEAQVQAELDRRIRYFVQQLGSEEKLEEFYGKTITEIKDDFHDQIADQLLVQQMQQSVTGDIRVIPKDVKKFFESIPKDSLPFMNAEVEWAHIVRVPKPSAAEISRVRRQLEEWRASFIKGEKDFCAIATIRSDDQGSAMNCGELGMVSPGTMVEAFDNAAMGLQDGDYSQVFQTEYGWHLMQMIERRGQQYNARHILLKPKTGDPERNKERAVLDSLARLVRSGSASFTALAGIHSEDEESRALNGMVTEPNSNSTRWKMSDMTADMFQVVDKLRPGMVSDVLPVSMPNGDKAYRIVQLLNRTEPHVANLKDDYAMLQSGAENERRALAVQRWLDERTKETYIHIHPDYQGCAFRNAWVKPIPE